MAFDYKEIARFALIGTGSFGSHDKVPLPPRTQAQ